ncbi:hypothetical protein [Sphingomicrobium flavum]|uniref:hypothetical protein n=1 Tax=Sphingomicrobium flavum TaxID=1229164 RepID=UPI0021ADAEB4|nr:hypothetical protein [Sphingomicrobium flavum]
MKPDPTHATSNRRGKKIREPEVRRYLYVLSATGNHAFAAQMIGRTEGAVRRKRRREADFAARCVAALAHFHEVGPNSEFLTHSRDLRTQPGSLMLVPGRGGRPPKIRRMPKGSLSAEGAERFFHHLAAVGNVKLAAEAVGISPSTIHRRRHIDPDFAERFDMAMDIAYDVLQGLIFKKCELSFDLHLRERMRTAGQDPSPPEVTVAQAMQYLWWMERKGRR